MGIAERIYPQFFSAFLMFPFRLGGDSQNDALDGEKIVKLFQQSKHWQYQPYIIQTGFDYNEYVYFYPYIWDILFTGQSSKGNASNLGVSFFTRKKDNWNNPRIEVITSVSDKGEKSISLSLKNIFLHLFHQSSIGILIFEVFHSDFPQASGKILKGLPQRQTYSVAEYLQFLNYARRIYAPFVASTAYARRQGNRIEFHHNNASEENVLISQDGIAVAGDAVQAKEYTPKVKLIFNDQEEIANNSSNGIMYISEGKAIKYRPILSPIITELLDSDSFSYENDNYAPIIDDRMFIHSFYSIDPEIVYQDQSNKHNSEYKLYWNHYFIKNLQEKFTTNFTVNSLDEVSDLWYQMIFIDWQGPTCQNRVMQSDFLRRSSYGRWSDFGTFYGFSRFSSVTLTNINAVPFLYNHFQSLYYQIAVLLLFYRGALLNFSDRSERLSKEIHQLKDTPTSELKNILRKVETLHRDFLLFRNRYWFREVTAQDQGIEIFDIWSKQLRNKELMEDVQNEVRELYQYVDTIVEKETSKRINILTVLGGIFIPLVIITAFFGMNLSFVTPWFNEFAKGFFSIFNALIRFEFDQIYFKTDYIITFIIFIVLTLIIYRGTRVIYNYFSSNDEYLNFPNICKLFKIITTNFFKRQK